MFHYHELLGRVTPVGAGFGQIPTLQRRFEVHAIEHALQKRQTTPGRDFAAGELHLKRVLRRHTMAPPWTQPLISLGIPNGIH
jgi:hypothetical protein